MSIEVSGEFSFPQQLVDKAVAFQTGNYALVDDVAYEANDLGRKIVQTQLVNVRGKDVSVGYVDGGEGTGYNLVLADEKPEDLGSFDALLGGNKEAFAALQAAFGGSVSSYTHLEMVYALVQLKAENVGSDDEQGVRRVAAWARTQVKRAIWVAKHEAEAIIQAPVTWKVLGL